MNRKRQVFHPSGQTIRLLHISASPSSHNKLRLLPEITAQGRIHCAIMHDFTPGGVVSLNGSSFYLSSSSSLRGEHVLITFFQCHSVLTRGGETFQDLLSLGITDFADDNDNHRLCGW